jgi:uncharacterized Tic20 family protein
MTETPNPSGDPHVGAEQPPVPPTSQPVDQPVYQQPPAPSPYQPNPYGQQRYGYAPPTGGISSNDRTWAAAAHWGTIVAAWLAMGFLAPLLIMLTVGNQSPFVRRHAVESLNFQISLLIYGAVAFIFSIVTLGLGLLVVLPLGLLALVGIIIVLVQASIRAGNGQDYRYPLTIRLVH